MVFYNLILNLAPLLLTRDWALDFVDLRVNSDFCRISDFSVFCFRSECVRRSGPGDPVPWASSRPPQRSGGCGGPGTAPAWTGAGRPTGAEAPDE